MATGIIHQTKLEWRLASESATLDLDTDLWTATAYDGSLIVAPTADECNAIRSAYERIERTAGPVRGWGGARMWCAQSANGEQFFGMTRQAAIRNAASESRTASESAYSAACYARAAQVANEDRGGGQ